MPNPLLGGHPADTSTDTQHKSLTPIPERVAGRNHPYRGMEQHGVADTVESYPSELDYEHESDVEYDVIHEEPAPIPVRIVNEAGREIDTFRVVRTYVNGQPARLVPAVEGRHNVTIRNLDATKAIYFDAEPIGSSGTAFGYPIPAATTFTFSKMETDVWAISEDGSQVAVAIYWEYTIPVKEHHK